MMRAHAIIGSGFGDEGKGLFTDYLAAQTGGRSCVVRFNGGAQAGHTVEMQDGRRHVFSHFGSGSFVGLPTFLSSFFVCAPITFLREHKELVSLGLYPDVFVDASCPVTTPFDMMINQITEGARGDKRHGSVGVGFGETLERQRHPGLAITVDDLKDTNQLRSKLETICNVWVPTRLATLGVSGIDAAWQERVSSEAIREHFIADVQRFLELIEVRPLDFLTGFREVIFEGAQGLLLDQHHAWFPHVTRSSTGVENVLRLAAGLGIDEIDAYYLTRCYTTRHGAGPLPHEINGLPYAGVVDRTNKPHPFQGDLRFAWLDLDLLKKTVFHDLARVPQSLLVRTHLGMSCLDQIEGSARFVHQGSVCEASVGGLLDMSQDAIGAGSALASFGPTRSTVKLLRKVPRPLVAHGGDRFLKALNITQDNTVPLHK